MALDDAIVVGVIAADPLARAGLANLLGHAGLGYRVGASLEALDAERDEPLPPCRGWIWDFDPDQPRLVERVAPTPVLALAADEAMATTLWARGAAAVLARSVDAEALRVALEAVFAGLRVFGRQWPESSRSRATTVRPELSARERDVLAGIADGASNRDVAANLGISVNTVKFHVRKLLDKLGAETRTELVVLAARWGLIQL